MLSGGGRYLELITANEFSPEVERHRVLRWWFTDISTNEVLLFGGDSLDPHHWAVLSRAGGGAIVPSGTVQPGIGDSGGDGSTERTMIGITLVTALAVFLAVSIGLRWLKAESKARAEKYEWPGGPGVASAILPGIQRLRGAELSGAPRPARPTPAHNWLLAAARRFVAQLAFLRNQEDAKPPSK